VISSLHMAMAGILCPAFIG